jgi:hypothetical protein
MNRTPGIAASLLLGAQLLAAQFLAEPAGAAGFCTALWAPVCATKNGAETTYSNPGCAKVDNAEIVRQGRCEDSPPATPTPTPTPDATPTPAATPNATPEPTKEPIFCTEDYAPVCGVKDGVSKTYSNACHAGADGASVSTTGECPKP